jgi:predicted transcriptional regulator
MAQKASASTSWVHLLQALASREAVEQMGLSARRVAELLGLAPSAVSQYLSGKRVERGFLAYAADERARTIARRTVESLVEAHESGEGPAPHVLRGAIALSELAQPGPRSPLERATASDDASAVPLRSLAKWVRRRVKAE